MVQYHLDIIYGGISGGSSLFIAGSIAVIGNPGFSAPEMDGARISQESHTRYADGDGGGFFPAGV